MAKSISKFETGNAKNIANLNVLIQQIQALGEIYKPTNPKILIENLQNTYTKASEEQDAVNQLLAPYSNAVNEREAIFTPFNKFLTKLRKVYKSTENVADAEMENFMTIIRKLKGYKKDTSEPSTNSEEEQKQHSTSQLSYDLRTDNLELLISLLENTPNYNPNEEEYKIATLKKLKEDMKTATNKVNQTYIPLNNARNQRNQTLYNAEDNLVDTSYKAKDYLLAILDSKSAQYKAISKIKFNKK